MDIIPVIDLLQGQVVRAKLGERHLYRPIESRLCEGSEPLQLVGALLELYPFESLYIADLDAIQGLGNHHEVVAAIMEKFPKLHIVLDAGLKHPEQLNLWVGLTHDMVIGSEGIQSIEQFRTLIDAMDPSRTLLSLDFGKAGFIGVPEILNNTALWPERIIVMTLARVGSQQGPDEELMKQILHHAGDREMIAAGGVRDGHDLQRLAQLGVSGVLLASALHDGHITAQDIRQ